MEKTPVSILQELMIKQGCVPIYEEHTTIVAGQQPQFITVVKCKTYTASGKASNKKQAKQSAAANMLKVLEDSKKITNSPLISLPDIKGQLNGSRERSNSPVTHAPSADVSDEGCNYVGKIQEYCQQRRLPNPVYEVVQENISQYAFVFKTCCSVSTTREEATASTKKLSKQRAAEKVWKRIVSQDSYLKHDATLEKPIDDVLKDMGVQMHEIKLDDEKRIKDGSKYAINMYKEFKCREKVAPKNYSVHDYHRILIDISNNITETMYNRLCDYIQRECSYHEKSIMYETIIAALQVKINKIVFPPKVKGVHIVGMKLNTTPTIMEIAVGSTQDDAELKALQRIIRLFVTLRE